MPLGNAATSRRVFASKFCSITLAPVTLYTATVEAVPVVFSMNNTSEAGFGLTTKSAAASSMPIPAQGPHSSQQWISKVVSAVPPNIM